MAKVGWNEIDLNAAFSQAEHLVPHKKGISTKLLWIILGVVLVLLLALGGLAIYVFAIV
jgi:flagellar basal body-associated protein FliL